MLFLLVKKWNTGIPSLATELETQTPEHFRQALRAIGEQVIPDTKNAAQAVFCAWIQA